MLSVTTVTGCGARSAAGRNTSEGFTKAQAAYNRGEFAKSEDALNAVLRLRPTDLSALRLLATVQAAQGKNERAVVTYKRIVRLDPGDHVSWHRLSSRERAMGDAGAATRHLERALEAHPGDTSYTDELARVRMGEGRYAEAAVLWGRLLNRMSKTDEGRVELLILRAKALQEAGEYADSRSALREALRLRPKDRALRAQLEAYR